jgi:hypothetical protein
LAVWWALFSVNVEYAMEYLAYAYCAFGTFDFAEAAAWTLFFFDIDLHFQVILVGVRWELFVGDLFSIWFE